MNSVRRLCPILLCSLAFAATAQAEPTPAAVPDGSSLTEMAAALAHAPPYMQADFAWASIYEMALAYDAEAERARRERHARAHRPGLGHWIQEAESYARHLAAIAGHLDGTSPAKVTVGPSGLVYLQLEGETLAVSGPRISEPEAFEARILERFCSLEPCDTLLAMQRPLPQLERPVPHRPPEMEVEWAFDARSGPVCSAGTSLVLQFGDRTDMARKRRLCSHVAGELDALAAALEAFGEKGGHIDWERLTLQPATDDGPERVYLNRAGDAILLTLPTLAANPALLSRARDWLAAQAAGAEPPRLVIPVAERLSEPTGL